MTQPLKSMPLSPAIFNQLAALVASAYDMTVKVMLGPGRAEREAMARFTLQYIIRKLFGFSYETIGKLVGNRDGGAVANACHKLESLPKADKYKAMVDNLLQQATFVSETPYDECVGHAVLLKSLRTHQFTNAYIVDVSDAGDGVLLRINGGKPRWESQRHWMICSKVHAEQVTNKSRITRGK